MNLENCIEVGSVSEFLDAVKQIYCDQDHQLFYRGVSKTQYATPEHDHPGIYRNKNWIDNEDKMFYELTAKCPEYFKDCKTTFEHLVMMQHYGYPTRLLDITSNPLVALYFACGGLNGSNSEDGQLISYHIKKNDIRNYESDRVSLLSTIALAKQKLNYIIFLFFQLDTIFRNSFKIKELRFIKERSQKPEDSHCIMQALDQLELFNRSISDDMYLLKKAYYETKIFKEFKNISVFTIDLFDKYREFITGRNDFITLFYSCEKHEKSDEEREKGLNENLSLINYMLSILEINIMNMRGDYDKFINVIKNKDYNFNSSLINSVDMRTIQCVLPKQNNPRLIAQQGAFLLFGFKDAVSDKTATPVVDPKMYGELCMKDGNNQPITTQSSGKKAEIIIKGSDKQKILDELKILGISNSTMFPEIDNIANELKNQYAKE